MDRIVEQATAEPTIVGQAAVVQATAEPTIVVQAAVVQAAAEQATAEPTIVGLDFPKQSFLSTLTGTSAWPR